MDKLPILEEWHSKEILEKFDNILSLDKALSILKARIASINFLFKLTSLVNKKFKTISKLKKTLVSNGFQKL